MTTQIGLGPQGRRIEGASAAELVNSLGGILSRAPPARSAQSLCSRLCPTLQRRASIIRDVTSDMPHEAACAGRFHASRYRRYHVAPLAAVLVAAILQVSVVTSIVGNGSHIVG